MNKQDQVTELFRCECSSIEHQFVVDYFPYDDSDGWNETFFQVHLSKKHPLWRRAWYAVRYIFGYQCRYGAFDEVVLQPNEVKRLITVLEERLTHIKK